MAIHIDPKSGLKIFNTRAGKATEKIAGKGYSALNDESLTALPEEPVGAVFSAEEQEKYQAFKERRRGAAPSAAAPRSHDPPRPLTPTHLRNLTGPLRSAHEERETYTHTYTERD